MAAEGKDRDDQWQDVLLQAFVRDMPREYVQQKTLLLPDLLKFYGGITDELERDWVWRELVAELVQEIEEVGDGCP